MSLRQPIMPPNVVYLYTTLIALYTVGFILSAVNYSVHFRPNLDLYGSDLVNAHLVFCILGGIACFLLSAGFWISAALYAKKSSSRLRYTMYGFWTVFLFKDLPFFVIELIAIMDYGWRSVYQGFCFVIQLCYFFFSFIAIWLSITWGISTLLEEQWGVQEIPRGSMQEGLQACLISPEPQSLTSSDRPGYVPLKLDPGESIFSSDRRQDAGYKGDTVWYI